MWIFLTWAGTWAAKVIDEIMETSDHQNIVMDEVVGLGITSWTIGSLSDGQNWMAWLAAFVLFRFFDILKPPPVRQVDLWSKKKAAQRTGWAPWFGGFGVMADDIVAGFQGLAVMIFLQWLHILQ
jgi:phosphatidylglycerophosphatase A